MLLCLSRRIGASGRAWWWMTAQQYSCRRLSLISARAIHIDQIENLRTLGPDVLPTKAKFNKREFRRRLQLAEHREIPIGAALLNQRILAGLGNYLRAEVLFNCGLNPWRKVGDLNEAELSCLERTAPELSLRSYLSDATANEEDRIRMRADESLVYQRVANTVPAIWFFVVLICRVCVVEGSSNN